MLGMTHITPIPYRRLLAWTTLALGAPALLRGQAAGWSGAAQASANALFGAAHTRLVSTAFDLGRADSTLSVRSALQLSYGDDRDEQADRRVTARTVKGSLGLDYRPFAAWSPFVFGTVESSFQQRIARRVDGGIGAKATFVRTERSELSLSLALLIERTRPLAVAGAAGPSSNLARWSWRFRTRLPLTPSLVFSHVTFYQPTVDHPGSYTVDTKTELEDRLWSALSFTATVHDRFDSEARGRGATSNHDGQLLFGLRTSF